MTNAEWKRLVTRVIQATTAMAVAGLFSPLTSAGQP